MVMPIAANGRDSVQPGDIIITRPCETSIQLVDLNFHFESCGAFRSDIKNFTINK